MQQVLKLLAFTPLVPEARRRIYIYIYMYRVGSKSLQVDEFLSPPLLPRPLSGHIPGPQTTNDSGSHRRARSARQRLRELLHSKEKLKGLSTGALTMAINTLRGHHGSEPPQQALMELQSRAAPETSFIDQVHAQNVQAARTAAAAGFDLFAGPATLATPPPVSFTQPAPMMPPPPAPHTSPRQPPMYSIAGQAARGPISGAFSGPGLLVSHGLSDELANSFNNGAAAVTTDPYMAPPAEWPSGQLRLPVPNMPPINIDNDRPQHFVPMGPTGYPISQHAKPRTPRPRSTSRRPKAPTFEGGYKQCDQCGYQYNGAYFGWCWSCKFEFRPGSYAAAMRRTASPTREESARATQLQAEIYIDHIDWNNPPMWAKEIWTNPDSPYAKAIVPQSPPGWLIELWEKIDSKVIDANKVPTHLLKSRLLAGMSMPPWRDAAPVGGVVPPTALAPAAIHQSFERAPIALMYPPAVKARCTGCVDGCQACMRLVTSEVIRQINQTPKVSKDKLPLWLVDMIVDPRSPFLRVVKMTDPPPWLANIWRWSHITLPCHLRPPQPKTNKAIVKDDSITFDCLLQEALKEAKHTVPDDDLRPGQLVAHWKAELEDYDFIIDKQNKTLHDLEAIIQEYVDEREKVLQFLDEATTKWEEIGPYVSSEDENAPPLTGNRPPPVANKMADALALIAQRPDLQDEDGTLKAALEKVAQYVQRLPPGTAPVSAPAVPEATPSFADAANADEVFAMEAEGATYKDELAACGIQELIDDEDMSVNINTNGASQSSIPAAAEATNAVCAPTSWEDGATVKKQRAAANATDCRSTETDANAVEVPIMSSDTGDLGESSGPAKVPAPTVASESSKIVGNGGDPDSKDGGTPVAKGASSGSKDKPVPKSPGPGKVIKKVASDPVPMGAKCSRRRTTRNR